MLYVTGGHDRHVPHRRFPGISFASRHPSHNDRCIQETGFSQGEDFLAHLDLVFDLLDPGERAVAAFQNIGHTRKDDRYLGRSVGEKLDPRRAHLGKDIVPTMLSPPKTYWPLARPFFLR